MVKKRVKILWSHVGRSLDHYPTYFLIGVFNTLFVITLRQIIGINLDHYGYFYYAISILASYAIGILVSFVMHKKITFRNTKKDAFLAEFKQLVLFCSNQSVGMILSMLFSLIILSAFQITNIDYISIRTKKMLAFGFSSFCISLLTYILNKKILLK